MRKQKRTTRVFCVNKIFIAISQHEYYKKKLKKKFVGINCKMLERKVNFRFFIEFLLRNDLIRKEC